MKIRYKNDLLELIDKKIISSDSIIELDTDKDATILGVLFFSNGDQKVLEFIKKNDESLDRIARLIITEEDISYLQSAKFYLEVFNGELKQRSNNVQFQFDLTLIKTDIKKKIVNEYKELFERILKLEKHVEALKDSKVLKGINITNTKYIQPGMVPVSIDDKGNFVALYPFSNSIVEINGQRAANGAVVIDSSMIKYKKNGKSIEQTFTEHAEAISAVSNLLTELINNQREIREQLNEIDIRLSTHINNGII